MAEANNPSQRLQDRRPLSPHLQIYKMMFSMVMSGLHRITGMCLYAGTLLLAWYFIAAASGRGSFDTVNWVYSSLLGRLVLFGFTWSLVHHTLGGIRHLIWDMGWGYELPSVERGAQLTLAGGVIITILLWVIGYGVMS